MNRDKKEEDLPPVGNGTYNVLLRLKKDQPNWVPNMEKRFVSNTRARGDNATSKRVNSPNVQHIMCFNPRIGLGYV